MKQILQTIFGQAIFLAVMYFVLVVILTLVLGDQSLQNAVANSVFGAIAGFCAARVFGCVGRTQVARFSKQAACNAGYLTLFIVTLKAVSEDKDATTLNSAIELAMFTLIFGAVTFLFFEGRNHTERIKHNLSWWDVILLWGLIALLIAIILLFGSRELATIAVALGILFSPVLPYDNDTDGADKRHQKWGIGFCALGVIYYFTLYPQLIEQVTLT